MSDPEISLVPSPAVQGPERVYQSLRTRIVEHALEPGARISISAEAARLGVSQTPVREALHRLEGDRLVVRSVPRGYRVTPLIDRDELVSLFEMRLLLEPWAAREAATTRLHNPASGLRRDLEALAALQGTSRDVEARRSELDHALHLRLLHASGNPLLVTTYEQLHVHVHVFRLHQADRAGVQAHQEHLAIVEAVEACDPEAAEAAQRTHLLRSFERLASTFEERSEENSAGADAGAGTPAPRSLPPRLR